MARRGHTITEYGLILGSIAVMCVVGVGLLSNNVSDHLYLMISDRASQATAAVLPYAAPPASTAPQTVFATTQSNAAQSRPSTSKGNDPLPAAALISPVNTRNTILVSGANGATQQLANTLIAHIQTLLQTEAIDQAQSQVLMQLANEAHTLATAEKVLEDAILEGKTEVTYNNVRYTTSRLSLELGISPPNDNWTMEPKYAEKLMAPFVQQYQTALTTGALSNPSVKAQVTQLSYQIVAIGDALSWSFDRLKTKSQPDKTVSTLNNNTADTFQIDMTGTPFSFEVPVASAKTRQNASKICTTSTGTDTGTQCTQ